MRIRVGVRIGVGVGVGVRVRVRVRVRVGIEARLREEAVEDPTPISIGGRCRSRAACKVSGEALSSLGGGTEGWWYRGAAGRRRA